MKNSDMVLFGIFLIAGSALAATILDSNSYMDEVINSHLKEEIRNTNLEPADLPDISTTNPVANYTHGKIYGLTNVQRLGDCTAPYFRRRSVNLDCTLNISQLNGEYDGQLQNVSFTAKFSAQSSLLHFQLTTDTHSNLPYMGNIYSSDLSVDRVDINGTDPALQHLLAYKFLSAVLNNFYTLIYSKFSEAIIRSVEKIPMPRP